MNSKIKRIIGILLVALIMTCTAGGCADRENIPIASGTGDAAGTTETLPSKDGEGNTADMPGTGECPEGYVYDYQVSMEPIPEEIAALGGPCEGTIHAFPSRIGMALTELEMEKDPVLKAEVEKRIPEIEAALEEEIGGEFVVDGVILLDNLGWYFFCTEVETGYQFDLSYANKEYDAQKNNRTSTENIINTKEYYKAKESIALSEELIPLVREIYPDGDIKIQKQGGVDVTEIFVSQYTEAEVDKCLEQEKLLMLWEALQAYDNTVYYNVSLTFYPPEYQRIIEEKYDTFIRFDFGQTFDVNTISRLGENGEVISCFRYLGIKAEKDEENLDGLLQEYREGNLDRELVWKYWII